MLTNDERIYAAAIYVVSFFTAFLGPLIIWLLKKDSPYIDYHGRQYFNFFITYSIYGFISFLLMFVLIGFVLIWIVGLLAFIFTIIAAIKAYDGETYRIPLTIRFFV